MGRFQKKPVVIEAMRYDPDGDLVDTGRTIGWLTANHVDFHLEPGHLEIETLEGTMIASPGDWIIRGIQGEFYPCKPDIFERTYDSLDD